jgi:hypothetical protein
VSSSLASGWAFASCLKVGVGSTVAVSRDSLLRASFSRAPFLAESLFRALDGPLLGCDPDVSLDQPQQATVWKDDRWSGNLNWR